MQDFLQILVVGITEGCIYGLIGLSFTAIFNACGVINFAQGDYLMVGGVLGWLFLTNLELPIAAAFVGVIVALAILGFGTYRLLIQPLMNRRAAVTTMIIGTIAIAMIITGVTGLQTHYNYLRVPDFLGIKPWSFGGIFVAPQKVLAVVATAVLVFAFWWMLKRTIFGMALRATGFSKDVATLVGIRTSSMVALSFVISASISGVAGLVVAPFATPHALMGLPFVVKGFIAAIIGGFGNPYAALVGGLLLGIVTVLLTGYWSSAHAHIGTFIVLLIVLLIRPQGLFGERI